MVAGGHWQLTAGCEEVEEEGAPQCGDVLVLHLWLNVEPVRLKGVLCARCAASYFQSILAFPVNIT